MVFALYWYSAMQIPQFLALLYLQYKYIERHRMATGDIYRLAFVGHLNALQEWVSIFHFRQIGDGSVMGAQALAEKVAADFAQDIMDIVSVNYGLDVIEVRQVTAPGTEGWDESVSMGGGSTGDSLPPQVAALIAKSTGLFGRRNRGRNFLPPPSEVEQAGGLLSSGAIAAYEAAVGAMISFNYLLGPEQAYKMVIYHDDLGTTTDVTNVVCRQPLATQKRRKAGIGS